MKEDLKPARGVTIEVDCPGLDEAIEKANRLVELLKEATHLIDSLAGVRDQKSN